MGFEPGAAGLSFYRILYHYILSMWAEFALLGGSWSSLVVEDEGWIGLSKKLLCLCQTPKNYATHAWHIPYLFDCWANPVAHLLLLKSSMGGFVN